MELNNYPKNEKDVAIMSALIRYQLPNRTPLPKDYLTFGYAVEELMEKYYDWQYFRPISWDFESSTNTSMAKILTEILQLLLPNKSQVENRIDVTQRFIAIFRHVNSFGRYQKIQQTRGAKVYSVDDLLEIFTGKVFCLFLNNNGGFVRYFL